MNDKKNVNKSEWGFFREMTKWQLKVEPKFQIEFSFLLPGIENDIL